MECKENIPEMGRSQRTRRPPAHMSDYDTTRRSRKTRESLESPGDTKDLETVDKECEDKDIKIKDEKESPVKATDSPKRAPRMALRSMSPADVNAINNDVKRSPVTRSSTRSALKRKAQDEEPVSKKRRDSRVKFLLDEDDDDSLPSTSSTLNTPTRRISFTPDVNVLQTPPRVSSRRVSNTPSLPSSYHLCTPRDAPSPRSTPLSTPRRKLYKKTVHQMAKEEIDRFYNQHSEGELVGQQEWFLRMRHKPLRPGQTLEEKLEDEDDHMITINNSRFLTQLNAFRSIHGLVSAKEPNWHDHKLKAFEMYMAVYNQGGYEELNSRKLWLKTYRTLFGAKSRHVQTANSLKKYYQEYLLAYTRFLDHEPYEDLLPSERDVDASTPQQPRRVGRPRKASILRTQPRQPVGITPASNEAEWNCHLSATIVESYDNLSQKTGIKVHHQEDCSDWSSLWPDFNIDCSGYELEQVRKAMGLSPEECIGYLAAYQRAESYPDEAKTQDEEDEDVFTRPYDFDKIEELYGEELAQEMYEEEMLLIEKEIKIKEEIARENEAIQEISEEISREIINEAVIWELAQEIYKDAVPSKQTVVPNNSENVNCTVTVDMSSNEVTVAKAGTCSKVHESIVTVDAVAVDAVSFHTVPITNTIYTQL